jgi:hypothetical protein
MTNIDCRSRSCSDVSCARKRSVNLRQPSTHHLALDAAGLFACEAGVQRGGVLATVAV